MAYELVDFVIDSKEPVVKVFAINEEAYTFITGVNDEFVDYISQYIFDANKSILENFRWYLEENDIEDADKIMGCLKKILDNEYSKIFIHIQDFRLDSLEDTTYSIENLPEWLLCIFADLLIKLTAIKQKTSSNIESVSIDTDILIMRKYQNFKWIKNYKEIL